MSGVFLLARRYIAFYKLQTAIVIACITLTIYLPAAMQMLVDHFQTQLVSRARTTPLVIGAAGSRFDLALHALYFEAQPPAAITMQQAEGVRQSGLARPIPLLANFRARGFPIVGTSLDYFHFRRLTIAAGSNLVRLGDCVLGARAARQLGLGPGDRLLSDPENVFDIAGAYPLNMRVVGVLRPAHSPDDNAVFVDVKTAWILQGVGHGHQELADVEDDSVILERTDDAVVAGAALMQYTEITDDNLASFHFHGPPADFPLTALIAVPHDEKAATLLMGRYLAPQTPVQILRPDEVVDDLLQMVFRVKRFFDLSALLLAIVTLLFLVLVILLSLRLRRREMQTMFKLGCSRFTIFWLQGAELSIVLAVSLLLAASLALATLGVAPHLLRMWLLA